MLVIQQRAMIIVREGASSRRGKAKTAKGEQNIIRTEERRGKAISGECALRGHL